MNDKANYIQHKIRKRDGSLRIIYEPKPKLKHQQRKIVRWFRQSGVKAGRYAHGFVAGRSIATHAKQHVGKRVIVKVDIHDFFGSTNALMVKNALRYEQIPADIIDKILDTCILDNVLPQGAPTSPVLSNLVLKRLDGRMAALAKTFNARYSRYADDLCFSSNNPKLNHILPAVDNIIQENSYYLNRRKTRVIRRAKRQIITGCVVNRELNVPRELRRKVRAQLYNLKRQVIHNKKIDHKLFEQVQGMISYFQSIKPLIAIPLRKAVREIETLLQTLST